MFKVSEFSEFLVSTSVGTELLAKVTPKAASNRLGEIFETAEGIRALKIYITQVPEQGKANEAVIELLAKSWRLPKSIITVKQGSKSKHKVFLIAMAKEKLIAHLKEHQYLEN